MNENENVVLRRRLEEYQEQIEYLQEHVTHYQSKLEEYEQLLKNRKDTIDDLESTICIMKEATQTQMNDIYEEVAQQKREEHQQHQMEKKQLIQQLEQAQEKMQSMQTRIDRLEQVKMTQRHYAIYKQLKENNLYYKKQLEDMANSTTVEIQNLKQQLSTSTPKPDRTQSPEITTPQQPECKQQ